VTFLIGALTVLVFGLGGWCIWLEFRLRRQSKMMLVYFAWMQSVQGFMQNQQQMNTAVIDAMKDPEGRVEDYVN